MGGTIAVARSGAVIATEVQWARRFHERTRGLRDRPPLEPGHALVLAPARQIHTFGLGYAIDVVFCDKRWTVRHIVRHMRPSRVTRPVFSAHYVIELVAGSLPADAVVGDHLNITAPQSNER